MSKKATLLVALGIAAVSAVTSTIYKKELKDFTNKTSKKLDAKFKKLKKDVKDKAITIRTGKATSSSDNSNNKVVS